MGYKFLKPIHVKDGTYKGQWSDHTLNFEYEGEVCEVETKTGVRGMNIPVTFEVVHNQVQEHTIKTIQPMVVDEIFLKGGEYSRQATLQAIGELRSFANALRGRSGLTAGQLDWVLDLASLYVQEHDDEPIRIDV